MFCVDGDFDCVCVVAFDVVVEFVLSREPVCAMYCDVVVFLDVLRDLLLCDCCVDVEDEDVRSLVVVCWLCLSAFLGLTEGCIVEIVEEGCSDELSELFV